MQIHVVQPGQSLFQIANAYGIDFNEIVEANEIPTPEKLVVGQSLVIPIVGHYYTVKAGDSLWSIGQKFRIPYQTIANINQINVNKPLQIGMRLYIPQDQKKRKIEVNAYVEPIGKAVSPTLENITRQLAPYLTYLSPFGYLAKRDGTLEGSPLGNLPDIAKANKNVLVMVIANIEEGAFSAELARIILNDMEIQDKFLQNIIQIAKREGFEDIHFDFEFLRPEDREAYNHFLRKAKQMFQKEGFLLSTALAPKTGATQKGQWYEAHDYKAHGEIVDYVIIMTYEWGYSGGPPMPVSPIGPVREVLEYAVTEIPPEKILMGQNLYGYDWTLPYEEGKEYAKALSPQQAIQLALKYHTAIQYDYKNQAPYIEYIDENNKEHIVWFEDARSIQAKFQLLKELNLRGISYWKIGLAFPQNWLLITDNFEVVKRK